MDMQKVAGVLMIFAGCTGLGVWYGAQFREQLRLLKELCHVLELFLSEIRFAKSTLPEGCLRVAQRVTEPFASLFFEIYNQSLENTGEGFGEVCNKVLQEGMKEMNIGEEEKKIFEECFINTGYEEERMQLKVMEQAKTELEKKIALLEEGIVTRCRLAFSLGTMSGLLIIILLW